MKIFSFIIILALLISVTAAPVLGNSMSAKQVNEYRLKAAYLLNFAKFISWPDKAFTSPQAHFVIGILGNNPFGNSLTPLTSRKVRNRTIELRYFNEIDEIKPCQILFISHSKKESLPNVLEACNNMPIFTISDIKGFIHKGGMLEFITINEHLHFSINLTQAQTQGLGVEAQLLALATEVIKANP